MIAPPIYLDECVDRRLADRLRARSIDVLTAVEAGTLGLDDEGQILFATRQNRPILSHNQRHFQRWHERFVTEGRFHAGMVLLPAGPLTLVELRAAMLVSWMSLFAMRDSALFRWHELQGVMTRGYRLPDFGEAETRQALAIDPRSG